VSTWAIREVIEHIQQLSETGGPNADALGIMARAAHRELEAIEKAAADLTRLHVEDFIYSIRGREKTMRETPDGQNTWDHPDVRAWGGASMVLASIAKSSQRG
jgi:hypothetical protein